MSFNLIYTQRAVRDIRKLEKLIKDRLVAYNIFFCIYWQKIFQCREIAFIINGFRCFFLNPNFKIFAFATSYQLRATS